MIIDGPIIEDPQDARYGTRVTEVPEEDASLLPAGDVLGDWVRVGSSYAPSTPGKSMMHEKFLRAELDPMEVAFENGRQEGYADAMREMAQRDLAKLEDATEALRDEVIIAARDGSPEKIKAALAALDAKTGYKPHQWTHCKHGTMSGLFCGECNERVN